VAALAAAVSCIGVLALPGSASASTVQCGARLKFDSDHAENTHLAYYLHCTENIQAYTIVSDKQIDFFGTEVLGSAFGQGTSELFSCEGQIPSYGFSCYTQTGKFLAATHTMIGEMGTPTNPCSRDADGNRQQFWLVVQSTQSDTAGKPIPTTSKPFKLGPPQCKKLKGGSGGGGDQGKHGK